jgi:hypothetical protein
MEANEPHHGWNRLRRAMENSASEPVAAAPIRTQAASSGSLAERKHPRWLPAAAVAVVVILITLLQWPLITSPIGVRHHDDGIYIVTAKALAEGDGYVINSLPESIAQTKYPVLFPAALSLVWKLNPSFPENLPLLRLVPLACMWIWMWLLWRIIGNELGERRMALWVVSLTLTSPMVLYMGTLLMSETMFAALGTWAVLLMVRVDRGTADGSLPAPLLLAAACAAAFHTRTIGVALLAPALLILLARRGARQTALFVAGWLLLAGPWFVWQAQLPSPADPVLAYYTHGNYSAWQLLGAAGSENVLRVIGLNISWIVAAPASVWPLLSLVPSKALVPVVAVLSLAILLRMGRSDSRAAAGWLTATAGIALLWAWPPIRFLIPVAPFLALGGMQLAAGQYSFLDTIGRFTGVALITFGVAHFAATASARAEGGSRDDGFSWSAAESLEAFEWIRANTPRESILAASLDPAYWLYAERRSIRAFAVEPYQLFYAPDSPAGGLGEADNLSTLLKRIPVSYLVIENHGDFAETEPLLAQLAAVEADHSGALVEAWTSAGGMVTVYEIIRQRLVAGDKE